MQSCKFCRSFYYSSFFQGFFTLPIYSFVFSFQILAYVLLSLDPLSSCLSALIILKNFKCMPFILVFHYFISITQLFYCPSLPLGIIVTDVPYFLQISFAPATFLCVTLYHGGMIEKKILFSF